MCHSINSKSFMGLMDSVLDSRLRYAGMSCGWSPCAMFLCKMFYSHITSGCQEGWEKTFEGIAFHVGHETIPSITSCYRNKSQCSACSIYHVPPLDMILTIVTGSHPDGTLGPSTHTPKGCLQL